MGNFKIILVGLALLLFFLAMDVVTLNRDNKALRVKVDSLETMLDSGCNYQFKVFNWLPYRDENGNQRYFKEGYTGAKVIGINFRDVVFEYDNDSIGKTDILSFLMSFVKYEEP